MSSLCSCVTDVWSCAELLWPLEFMCNWCLELFRLIVSYLSSCVTDVWNISYTWRQTRHNKSERFHASVRHEHIPVTTSLSNTRHQLMSGVVQTYCVLSEFMCNWCLELFRLIMSGLCSCVTDVCILSSVFMCKWCLVLFRRIVSYLSSCVTDVWSCSDLLCLVCVHTISLINSRQELHMNSERIQ
jgi:hypothetical protein